MRQWIWTQTYYHVSYAHDLLNQVIYTVLYILIEAKTTILASKEVQVFVKINEKLRKRSEAT